MGIEYSPEALHRIKKARARAASSFAFAGPVTIKESSGRVRIRPPYRANTARAIVEAGNERSKKGRGHTGSSGHPTSASLVS